MQKPVEQVVITDSVKIWHNSDDHAAGKPHDEVREVKEVLRGEKAAAYAAQFGVTSVEGGA